MQWVWKNIKKSFWDGSGEKLVLKGIDLTLKSGNWLFITGPSGSGKTSLLNIMGLIEKPDEGTVIWNDTSINWNENRRLTMLRRKEIGYIYQNFNLVSYLNVLDNITLPLLPERITSEDKKRALALMEQLGIASLARSYPLNCSGGEKQRIAIARALLKEPSLLLADEPTGELDRENSLLIMELFRNLLSEQKTILVVVTHNRELIRENDLQVSLQGGKLIWP